MVRLFVGGLASDVQTQDLIERFQPFGDISNCQVMPPKENDVSRSAGASCRGFGFLDLQPANDAALRRCLGVVRLNVQGGSGCSLNRFSIGMAMNINTPHL